MNTQRKQFLKELKIFGLKNNVPNITEKNAQFLHFLISMKNASSVLEIGTANGYSTIWLADGIENQPNARLLSIDRSSETHNKAVQNIQKQNLGNIVELKLGNALDILPTLTEKFDIIFIDAQKILYSEFFQLSKPLLKSGGLIIVDDVLKFPKKTDTFHKTMEKEKDYSFVIIPIDEDDGVMLIQRK